MDKNEIENIIRSFFEKTGVSFDSITVEKIEGQPETVVFNVSTKEGRLFIGRDADSLHALNHLMGRIFSSKCPDDQKFLIDINGYYIKNIETIKQKAKFAAERAKTFQAKIELDPMNSFERRIIHSLFSEDRHISTHSEGFGKDRRVVLSYSEQKEEEL